uniref:Uncharacterized protein n=1 Tax=Hippocampus comes TaxID=109280 RepID=A0A3Q2XYN9_HIPCM
MAVIVDLRFFFSGAMRLVLKLSTEQVLHDWRDSRERRQCGPEPFLGSIMKLGSPEKPKQWACFLKCSRSESLTVFPGAAEEKAALLGAIAYGHHKMAAEHLKCHVMRRRSPADQSEAFVGRANRNTDKTGMSQIKHQR